MPEPLTPPDLKRCQAEKPNGHNFMTLGGSPGLKRCAANPKFIITEREAAEDGQHGSMSLCADCLSVFLKQGDQDSVDIKGCG